MSSDLDVCQVLIVLRDRAVVLLSAFVVVHPLQDLLDCCRHGNGCAYAVRAVKRVVQVLDVKVDLEAGLVIARDHHGCLRIHNCGARIADIFTRTIACNYAPDKYQANDEERAEMYRGNILETADTSVADYVWLPIQLDAPCEEYPNGRVRIEWKDSWTV